MTTLVNGSDLTVAAKNIRTELKAAFPAVKFAVRSERFSMGDAIRINWTDGPTIKQVDAITDKYADGDFNGMDDSYNYREGSERDWTKNHGGAKYITTSRNFSPAFVARGIEAVAAKYGNDGKPSVEDYENGRAYNKTPIIGGTNHSHSWQCLVNQWFSDNAA